jgi:hypothetical protein
MNDLLALLPLLTILFLIVGLPIIYIIRDKRITREQKVGWAIIIFFTSWIGLAIYLVKNKK